MSKATKIITQKVGNQKKNMTYRRSNEFSKKKTRFFHASKK